MRYIPQGTNMIDFIINSILILSGIMLCGFVVYKCWELNSWELGVKKFLTDGFQLIYKFCTFAYYELTGKVPCAQIINASLMLQIKEQLELVARFYMHPYDTPVLVSYIPNINGISWFDISAPSLISHYKELGFKGIVNIATNIIQTFYMETRNIKVYLFIKIATPTRLCFAIALSEEGRNFLEKQCADVYVDENIIDTVSPLEEEIDLFPPSEEEPHDSGIS